MKQSDLPQDNEWHHIIFDYNGAKKYEVIKVYVGSQLYALEMKTPMRPDKFITIKLPNYKKRNERYR